MAVTIQKYSLFLKIQMRMREMSTGHVYLGTENGWTGYEQLAGLRYVSTKRAELEVLNCVCDCHVNKER